MRNVLTLINLVRSPSLVISTRRMSSSVQNLTSKLSQLGITNLDVYPSARPEQNPVDIFRSYIAQELETISGVSRDLIFPAVEFTSTPERGDLLIPVPRLRLKGVKPDEKAAEWASKFPKSKYFESVSGNGPFMQFVYKADLLYELVVREILDKKLTYGETDTGKGKKVIVEFSSPNIAKPFHAGHLRSTIIGGFISNLHEKHGFDVTRINYLGDWGKQFGLLSVALEKYGDEEKLKKDPINHLFELYVRINSEMAQETDASSEGVSEVDSTAREHFKRMEEGDEKALALWKRLRALSIDKYQEIYARLNIKFDEYSGESQVSQEKLREVIEQLNEKKLTFEDRGALLIDLSKYQKRLGKTLIRKSDGTTLYQTRDIGEAIRRYDNYHFDKMVYVAASQQDLHFAQFFKILQLMDLDFASKLEHVNFGMVQGMSTRKGTVVFLDHILNEAKEAMHQVMQKNEAKYSQIEDPEKVADLVGLSAVMIQDMQSKRINNYTFDWKRMLSFEGDTGPYLQYAHSRLCSMERNSGFTNEDLLKADFSLIKEPVAATLARILVSFVDVLHMSLKNLEPSTLITYLFKLTHTVSSCYDVLWVSGQERELALARMALYASARQVLYNGMIMLGLTPVERM